MTISMFSALSVIIGGALSTKIIDVHGIHLGAGAFLFPWVWVCIRVNGHVFGPSAGTRLMLTTVIALFTATGVFFIALQLPAVHGTPDLFTSWAQPLPKTYLILLMSFSVGQLASIAGLYLSSLLLDATWMTTKYFVSFLFAQVFSVIISLPLLFGPVVGWPATLTLIEQRVALAPLFAAVMAVVGAFLVRFLRRRYGLNGAPFIASAEARHTLFGRRGAP
jgi:uncharacterized PurR-regulated membrane protein YhhQ (DUF165 family)